MTLKPGSSDSDAAFADSLAEEIDNALKMEWLAIKEQPLPDAGKADRRLLFAAIAQGVLSYLKRHDMDLLAAGNIPVIIHSPLLQSSGGGGINLVIFTGSFFPPEGNVAVTWDDPATSMSIQADANGSFQLPFNIPASAAPGRHVIEARDGAGNVALAVFEKN